MSKDTVELNSMINELDITNIYRVFHPTIAEHTFSSSLYLTFTTIDHVLVHETHFNKLKKIIHCMMMYALR